MARPQLGRAIAAITTASVAMLLTALPASADPAPDATTTGEHEVGLEVKVHYTVTNDEGKEENVGFTHDTALQQLQLANGGAKFSAYSAVPDVVLDKDTPLHEPREDDAKAKIVETPEPDPRKINWILRHSYPFVTVEALTSGLPLQGLKPEEAIAATQAAIWHFDFGATLDDDNADRVKSLYTYLTGDKNTGADNDEEPKLEVTLPTLTGKAGEKIGPVKVSTTATELALTVTGGVKITDKDGKELAAKDIKDGSELFVQVPADTPAGQGSFELKATHDVSRALGGTAPPSEEPKPDFQFLLFAQTLTKSAGVAVSWQSSQTPTTETPAPQASNGPTLANTGVSIFVPLGIGVLLLAAGAGALLFLRRRRA